MKTYLMSVHISHDDAPPPTEVLDQLYKDVDAYNQTVKDAGAWVFGGGLHPPSTATVVRAHEGETVTTDGPYLESREYLGGFWIIRAADLDAALDWATKASVACRGPVEVRPFEDEA